MYVANTLHLHLSQQKKKEKINSYGIFIAFFSGKNLMLFLSKLSPVEQCGKDSR